MRIARPDEVDAAVRKLLLTPFGAPDDRTVMEFLLSAADRGIDVCSVWVAVRGSTIETAVMPVVNPGKAVLLLVPRATDDTRSARSLEGLCNAVCDAFHDKGVRLVQVLAEDHANEVLDSIRSAGFKDLADLRYLERPIRGWSSKTVELPGTVFRYSRTRHEWFAQAILNSYVDTLDCPALSGVREIDDVIAGHQAAGDFDPEWWHVIVQDDLPVAVLLLAPYLRSRFVELVYIGIVPSHRGQGLGRKLLQLAISKCASERFHKLTLAVDSTNVPAIGLYTSHGMKEVGSRRALIRVLGRAV
jgi:ribosomal protein S18 acetylase RimI-like enzyme